MTKTMLQAKLHGVRVTEEDLHYEASCAIDELLLEASRIRELRYIEIYDVNSGERNTPKPMAIQGHAPALDPPA